MLLVIARNQDQTHLRAEHLEAGLKFVINSLDETYIDAPFASKLVRASADKETVLCTLSSYATKCCPFHALVKIIGYQIQLDLPGRFDHVACLASSL